MTETSSERTIVSVSGPTEERPEDTASFVDDQELLRIDREEGRRFFTPFATFLFPDNQTGSDSVSFKHLSTGADPDTIDRGNRSSLHIVLVPPGLDVMKISFGELLAAGGLRLGLAIDAEPVAFTLPGSTPVSVRGNPGAQFTAGWKNTRTRICRISWNEPAEEGFFHTNSLTGDSTRCEDGSLLSIANALLPDPAP